jgi:hypothetical protein
MSRQGSPLWKRLLKITAILVAVALSLVSSWIHFQQRNDLILDQLQVYLDEAQSGQLEAGSMDLELFRKFPLITLSFDSAKILREADQLRPIPPSAKIAKLSTPVQSGIRTASQGQGISVILLLVPKGVRRI